VSWFRYGRAPQPDPHEQDELLDRFMPRYDVVERHRIHVSAPPAVTLEAAKRQDLLHSGPVRAMFRTREIVLGSNPDERTRPQGLLAAVQSLGWGILAEAPEREVVVGAVTKPWEADVTFQAVPPDQFAAFARPGLVKIAWTLRVDPVDAEGCVFLTETRAVATDPTARAKFRLYWACASPGIALIRRLSLHPLKRDAERRAAIGECAQGT